MAPWRKLRCGAVRTCGQTFVSRNLPHSCAVVSLDEHFAAAPGLRAVFDAYLTAARESGPVTVNATKSRVSFQVRMRFAGIEKPRRTHLVATFVLTRRIVSDRLRVEPIAPYYYVHRIALRVSGRCRRRAARVAGRGLPGGHAAPSHGPELAAGAATRLS